MSFDRRAQRNVTQTLNDNSAGARCSTDSPTRSSRPRDRAAFWPWCSRLLGAVLLGAACLKGQGLATSSLFLPSFGARRAWVGIVEIELVVGAWLIFGAGGRRTWVVAFVLWTIFLCVAIAEAVEGAASCHCFGRLSIDPRYTAAFDALCIAVLWIVRPPKAGPTRSPRLLRSRIALIGAVALGGVAFGAWTLLRQPRAEGGNDGFIAAGETVLLSPEKWIGKPFVLGGYTDLGAQLDRGEWMVLFYHHDCEHCRRAVPRYLQWSGLRQSLAGGPKLALVEMPPYASPGEALVPASAPVPTGRLTDSQDWFVTAPLALLLHDGTVRAVATGDEAEDPEWIDRNSAVAVR